MGLLRRRTKPGQQNVALYDVNCPYCEAEMRAPAGIVRCASCHGKLTIFPDEKPGRARVAQRRSTSGELERLAHLHTQGALSDESFAAAKQRLLKNA
jgi:predicted DCC family thiol-disulfide oxidoreductase YuxK